MHLTAVEAVLKKFVLILPSKKLILEKVAVTIG
jgi:hypothetical protein